MTQESPEFQDSPTNSAISASDASASLKSPTNESERLREEVLSLQTTAGRLRRINESLPQLIWTCLPDGNCDYLSPQWNRYTGFPTTELLGMNWLKRVMHPDDQERIYAQWMEAVHSRQDYAIEYRIRRFDGAYRWFKASGAPVHDASGNVAYWFGTCTDIDDLKIMTEAYAQSERNFKGIFNNAAVGMVMATPEGRLLKVNPAFCRIIGYSESELLQKNFIDITAPEDREWNYERFQQLVADRQWGFVIQKRYIRKDGSRMWAEVTVSIIRGLDEIDGHVLAVIQDISGRKAAEAARLESERSFRQLANFVPQMIWTADSLGRILYCNQQWYAFTGADPSQTVELEWRKFLHPEEQDAVLIKWREAVIGQMPYESEVRLLRAQDKAYRWVLVRGVPLHTDDDRSIKWYGSCTDIDDQKTLLNHLQQSEERLKVATTSANIGIWEWDLNTKTIALTEIERRLMDIGDDHPITEDDLFARIRSSDLAEVRAKLASAIANKTDYVAEFRIERRDGALSWLSGRGRAVYDDQGHPIRMYGVNFDITKEKVLEQKLRQAFEAAESANQMKSAFLANMSHEIRTPLSAIMGFSALLLSPDVSQQDKQKFQESIKRNGEQLSTLINDILDLSKIEVGHLKIESIRYPVRDLLSEVCAHFEPMAKEKGLAFKCEFESGVPEFIGTDPVRARQILTNIIGNAIKFTDIGSVRISVTPHQENGIRVLVSDTGIGIEPAHIDHLFRPFSQADPSITRKYGGTGLGLSLSRKLARAMGGDLILKFTEPGAGSQFKIIFADRSVTSPTVARDPDANRPAELASDLPLNLEGFRVLLIDDAPDNQALFSCLLEQYGAVVETANNGQEGLERALRWNPDLVLMDLQMPIMDGFTATKIMRERGFTKPIIALTAHAMQETQAKCAVSGFNGHLSKPIDRDVLLRRIASFAHSSTESSG